MKAIEESSDEFGALRGGMLADAPGLGDPPWSSDHIYPLNQIIYLKYTLYLIKRTSLSVHKPLYLILCTLQYTNKCPAI